MISLFIRLKDHENPTRFAITFNRTLWSKLQYYDTKSSLNRLNNNNVLVFSANGFEDVRKELLFRLPDLATSFTRFCFQSLFNISNASVESLTEWALNASRKVSIWSFFKLETSLLKWIFLSRQQNGTFPINPVLNRSERVAKRTIPICWFLQNAITREKIRRLLNWEGSLLKTTRVVRKSSIPVTFIKNSWITSAATAFIEIRLVRACKNSLTNIQDSSYVFITTPQKSLSTSHCSSFWKTLTRIKRLHPIPLSSSWSS